jgi:hypothetical protein
MTWSAGLTTNRELYVTALDPRFSVEALVNLSYDFFIHGDLGTDIITSLTLFPSLTEDDRYRAEFNGKYRQEIVTDLFVSLSGWYSFDSRAPGDQATIRQEDYGVVTSLGWSF